MRAAARAIQQAGSARGGDQGRPSVQSGAARGAIADRPFYDGRQFVVFERRRVPGGGMHGSGCALLGGDRRSSGVGGGIALRRGARAKLFVTRGAARSFSSARDARCSIISHAGERAGRRSSACRETRPAPPPGCGWFGAAAELDQSVALVGVEPLPGAAVQRDPGRARDCASRSRRIARRVGGGTLRPPMSFGLLAACGSDRFADEQFAAPRASSPESAGRWQIASRSPRPSACHCLSPILTPSRSSLRRTAIGTQ